MEIERARRLISILPPKLINFFIRYPPRNPSLRTIYSKEDKSLLIARNLHDFLPVTPDLHTPTTGITHLSSGKPISTVFLPLQNPFKPSRDPRSGKFHGPRYSLRRQADIIKLAMRFGVAELLPPCAKMNRLLYGKRRPMVGTLYPKGTYEERTRAQYTEKKQESLEEALRIVAMRKMVRHLHRGRLANL
jgi:large subunit ribosomal protein L25